MSTAPYWGKLPAPAAATMPPSRPNRHSDDYGSSMDQAPADDKPPQRPQRFSVQTTNTTNTEAPTESTFSPFASPTASSFLGQGLAPRPPSYPYRNTPDYPPDIADKRSHRRTRTREDIEPPDLASPTPPAAPDVPRAPPLSYRHPYSNGGTPDPYAAAAAMVAAASKAARESASPVVPVSPLSANMESREGYYPRTPRSSQPDHLPMENNRRPMDSPQTRVAGEVPMQHVRKGSVKEVTTGRSFPLDASSQPRRASATSQPDRRRKFANDRSPLQRLELTLDSISKEEKRAKVEAAEQRARERARRAAEATKQSPSTPQQQVRFRERAPSASGSPREKPAARPTQHQTPRSVEPPVAVHRGPLTQNPPGDARPHQGPDPDRSVPVPVSMEPAPPVVDAASPPAAAAPVPQILETGNMGTPKRNLSFRERAAQQDLKPPNGLPHDSPVTPSTAPPPSNGGFSLTRSGSNKLKKDPPGDRWYRLRVEAQNALPQSYAQSPAHLTVTAAPENGYFQGHSQEVVHTPQQTRDIDSYPSFAVSRQIAPPTRAFTEPPTQPQLHSQLQPQPQPQHQPQPQQPQPHPQPGIRRHDTEPIPRTTQTTVTFEDDPRVSKGYLSDGDSRATGTDLRRAEYTPGDGLYLPPNFLDEWKQATVGSLSGTLLHLAEDLPQGVGKDKTWWESEGSKRGISARPRKAEAFDGEYAETNGNTSPPFPNFPNKPQVFATRPPLELF